MRPLGVVLFIVGSLVPACSLQSFDALTAGDGAHTDQDSAVGRDAQAADANDEEVRVPVDVDAGDAGDADAEDPYVAAVLADEPEGYWRLEEVSGVSAKDASGKNNHGTIVGAGGVSYEVKGALAGGGKSFELDGTAYITVPDVLDIQSPSGFTIEAWIRPTATDSAFRSFFRKETISPTGPVDGVTAYFNAATPRLAFEGWKASTLTQFAAFNGALAEFTHVAVTNDGSISRLYVNGNFVVASAAATLGTTTEGALWGREWKGGLDELALYLKPLSAVRIRAHHQAAQK